jgi:predicted ATP-grasp superfamily ATP-dependent carboligase
VARVLVLDGHCSAALAFVRSLGRAGHWVAVGAAAGHFAPAALSRYCGLVLEYPPPITGASAFVECVLGLCRRLSFDLVVPLTDATMWPLSNHTGLFRGVAVVAVSDPDSVRRASDKHQVTTSAQELDVPAPDTRLVKCVRDLGPDLVWEFPVVLKDRFSVRWVGDKGVAGSVIYAYSKEDLLEKVRRRLDAVGDVLLQQFIDGVGVGFSCFAHKGEVFVPFQWQRIREKDPRGSGSSARKSVEVEPAVFEYSQKLIKWTGIQGLSMVEFKKDRRSGRFVLMEVNGRAWGSLQLPIHCGLDYPAFLLRWYLEHCSPPKQIDYADGITCRWFAADLQHLENLWQGRPPGWPFKYPSFWGSAIKVAIPWYPGLRYDDLSLLDPRPGLAGVGRWVRSHVMGGS